MIKTNEYITKILIKSHEIDVSIYDDSFLYKTIQKRMAQTNCNSLEEFCSLIEHNIQESQYLINSLQISYSEFFRNPLTFAVLEQIVLPALLIRNKTKKHNEIRIWSAASAAGQEAYSIAIALEELRNNCNYKFNYRIFATDQSESQIQEAEKGQYHYSAIKNTSLRRVDEWFYKNDDVYTIKPELKKNIEFSVFDLFSEKLSCPPTSIFGDFDLVFSANLYFYYKAEYRQIIIDKTTRCLANGAYLVSGETERDIFLQQNYQELFPQSAIFCVNSNRKKI